MKLPEALTEVHSALSKLVDSIDNLEKVLGESPQRVEMPNLEERRARAIELVRRYRGRNS